MNTSAVPLHLQTQSWDACFAATVNNETVVNSSLVVICDGNAESVVWNNVNNKIVVSTASIENNRKTVACPSAWTWNIRKDIRVRGLPYVRRKNVQVREKFLKEIDYTNCRSKCSTLVTSDERMTIF